MEYIRTIHPAIYGFTDCCVNDSVDCNNKGLDFFGTKGHAVVICGMNGDSVKYMDPSDDPREGGFRHMHYNDFVNDGLVKWTNTLTMVTNPPDGLGCSNCELDPGEERIDCGGPNCPPCEDIPEEQNIRNSIYNGTKVMAYKKITANASVRVLSGQQGVSFMTTDTGLIVLNNGFKVYEGTEFKACIGDLSGAGRACDRYCNTAWLYPKLSRHHDRGLAIYDLLYAKRIEYEIYNKKGKFIYSDAFDITQNGGFWLWDLWEGAINNHTRVVYDIYYTIHYCTGLKSDYKHRFIVRNVKVNHTPPNEEPDETENFDPNQSLSSAPLNIQEELSSPTLTILPNPNAGSFQLETNIPLSDIATLKVTNMLGATIYEMHNLSSYTIQLPAVAAGQHLVVVVLKDGRVMTEKMIIQQ